jgi:hypothetical protein
VADRAARDRYAAPPQTAVDVSLLSRSLFDIGGMARGSYGRVVNFARDPGALYGAVIVAIMVNSVGGLLGR